MNHYGVFDGYCKHYKQVCTIINNYLRINIHIYLFHFVCTKAPEQCIVFAMGSCVDRISVFCATKLPLLQVIVKLRIWIAQMIAQLTSTNNRFDNYTHWWWIRMASSTRGVLVVMEG
ncbi:hypothetical protein GLYMA_07G158851v4 [Glycine max]|nr:hypothetical protein GLYMA_07G158851v4 [Glycine max]